MPPKRVIAVSRALAQARSRRLAFTALVAVAVPSTAEEGNRRPVRDSEDEILRYIEGGAQIRAVQAGDDPGGTMRIEPEPVRVESLRPVLGSLPVSQVDLEVDALRGPRHQRSESAGTRRGVDVKAWAQESVGL
jgi:hypothetical protein